ncbi:hypothetical protein [Lentzea sp. E54]|uniref:hypothetical protein n=1 Tax=Lentzea xerophila TaxID=3435883 RepID=UPI003DA27ECC
MINSLNEELQLNVEANPTGQESAQEATALTARKHFDVAHYTGSVSDWDAVQQRTLRSGIVRASYAHHAVHEA